MPGAVRREDVPAPRGPQRVLVVTAVAPERDAVRAGLAAEAGTEVEVRAPGVGPAAAAAGTATALALAGSEGRPFTLVVSAGIGGGFAAAGARPGDLVVADRIVAADLGSQTPGTATGFTSVAELGFGTAEHRTDPALVRAVAGAVGARTGPVLTVSTTTGTAERADELSARHPGAVAEGMEGFGVAEAAAGHGVPALEIRAVSNPVGPRDRSAWRIAEALDALTAAMGPLIRSSAGAPPWT
ncbi:futalosine hydrolase [Streptomyces sp. NRRL F-5053]|uniref:futalosine hydrolase n=1 Tax=Streptomyces sp. NRRL F-5053 TaxID=1463854 RepID=UPI000AB5A630|nr:futalosine hydrolase [Streptomyces sp. NRRL F-5053]